MNAPAENDRPHPLLYRHSGGHRLRVMAQASIWFGGVAWMIFMGSVFWHGRTPGGLNFSPLFVVTVGVITLTAALFVFAACSLARQFVVHFEIWPSSSLAVVRTAGVWSETIVLVSWVDFRMGRGFQRPAAKGTDPHTRVQLRSGRRLVFDHVQGKAPQGWPALHRFLEKCSVPECCLATIVELSPPPSPLRADLPAQTVDQTLRKTTAAF